MSASLTKVSPYILGILRIVSGLLFMEHGTQKLFGFPKPPPHGTAHLLSLVGFEGTIELVGGLLVVLGFQTRIAAFLMSGEMAIAYFSSQFPKSFFPILNGGESAIFFCFIFFYLFFSGPGAFSLDNRREGALDTPLVAR